jgi:hypothetical protein
LVVRGRHDNIPAITCRRHLVSGDPSASDVSTAGSATVANLITANWTATVQEATSGPVGFSSVEAQCDCQRPTACPWSPAADDD